MNVNLRLEQPADYRAWKNLREKHFGTTMYRAATNIPSAYHEGLRGDYEY